MTDTLTDTSTAHARAAAKYRPVFERIAAGALDRELARELPFEQINWLREAGFGAARIPAEFGGDGLGWAEFTDLLIELATADSHIPQALRGHIALVEDSLYHHGRGDDRSGWLRRFAAGELAGNAWTEPGAGGTATVLAETDAGLVLDGRKFYTTGTIFADWIDVTAKRPDGSHVSVIVATRTSGVETYDDWDGFGQRLTGSGTTVFTNAAVDPAHVFAFENRFPYQTALYQHILLVVLAGIAQAAVTEAGTQVRERKRVFGNGNAPLVRQDPQILQVVGEISAKAYVARAAALSVAHSLDRVFAAREQGADVEKAANIAAELESARAQTVLSTLVPEAAGAIFNALGASSTSASKALDRHWRNARTVATHNPFIYKARIVGDWEVNAAEPPFIWGIGEAAAQEAAGAAGLPLPAGTRDQPGTAG
ncbi:acyl-CoA dehydrogenase family protein [Arthrobacter sp. Sa2CUA1]|uniref:Acyl-CoA dehydrogenase family protein n=2 Tax=Arthrobacter TaxID=1663 RepID=A0ABR8UR75_9MICC|nr:MULTISPECIES: acyl-CoA dehydrogenase family protein [Arthrobacter]MBD7995063.1 acyl-CoA dehydrogenase family protein [Arthrobacter gallicola]MBD8042205.1 acyl-CoA dehydrogenase family protein [Arthrobacter pullicola]